MIELFDGYWIDVDQQCYTLKRNVKGTSKQGKPIERVDVRGYYQTLEGALKALGKEMVKDKLADGSHTLTEALNAVSEARQAVENLVKGGASL